MLGPKGSISLEMKDDEAHSIWNMFSNWCSDVTKEQEKENKRLKKEADKLVKATKNLRKKFRCLTAPCLLFMKIKMMMRRK